MKKQFVFGAALSCLLMAGCSPDGAVSSNAVSSSEGSAESAVTPQDPLADVPAPPPPPLHNYVEQSGGVYYYSKGMSKNASDSGQAAGEVLGFRYMGMNGAGEDVVMNVDSRGVPQVFASCKRPCKIIRASDGTTLLYNPESIIGAVFEDIANGQMKGNQPQLPAARIPADQPSQVSNVPAPRSSVSTRSEDDADDKVTDTEGQ